jgi:hypothetical protein
MLLVGEAPGPGLDLRFQRQHLLHRHRQVAQRVEVAPPAFAAGVPACLASNTASRNSAASCVVKALVEATPISGPARVRKRSAHSRTMADSGTLQIASVRPMPSALACLIEARVSAVSPDCEMATTSARDSATEAR